MSLLWRLIACSCCASRFKGGQHRFALTHTNPADSRRKTNAGSYPLGVHSLSYEQTLLRLLNELELAHNKRQETQASSLQPCVSVGLCTVPNNTTTSRGHIIKASQAVQRRGQFGLQQHSDVLKLTVVVVTKCTINTTTVLRCAQDRHRQSTPAAHASVQVDHCAKTRDHALSCGKGLGGRMHTVRCCRFLRSPWRGQRSVFVNILSQNMRLRCNT